jgi:hypothetical protein
MMVAHGGGGAEPIAEQVGKAGQGGLDAHLADSPQAGFEGSLDPGRPEGKPRDDKPAALRDIRIPGARRPWKPRCK